MTKIRATFFKGPASNVTPTCTKHLEFDKFAQRLSAPNKGPKDGSYFVRGVCRGDRSNKNMLNAWLGVVDADQGVDGGPCPPFDAAVDALKQMDFEFCAYTSFSHTPKAPRYRILFPLSQSITTPEAVSSLYRALLSMLKAEDIDLRYTQESATFSQAWYPPRHMTEAQQQAFRFAQGGFKTLVPAEVLPQAKKPAERQQERCPVDVRACIEAMRIGADVHNSMNSIIAHLAAHGVHKASIEALAGAVVQAYAPREKVLARLAEIPRSVRGAVFKFGDRQHGNKTRRKRWAHIRSV